ncbi:MAG: DNA polymerase III subunit gamma/tau [Flavobacteriales bacterium]|nr:MAG: DNA polymerase III subunit gamma/tau [Flavobacteriales bacterium]
MSDFIVSALKYRPSTFEDVVGQQHVTRTLINSIKENKIPSALLFCGPRGVGKTSSARIFAREINDYSKEDELSFNIFELDAASNNKADDIRDLIEKVRIPPQKGKYKVYIIDEVHMLSKHAENAFLKTLEEPPPYVVFILATTEKNKILPTIISRCQIYDFNRIKELEIVEYLNQICKKENIDFELPALNLIAKKSDGSMRDSLTILDRVVNYSNNKILIEETSVLLNVIDDDKYLEIVQKTQNGNLVNAIEIFNKLSDSGIDEKEFMIGLIEYYRNLILLKVSKYSFQNENEKHLIIANETSNSNIINIIKTIETSIFNYDKIESKKLLVEILLMKISEMFISSEKTIISSITDKSKKKKSELIYLSEKKENEVKKEKNNEKSIEKNNKSSPQEVSAFSISSLKIKRKKNQEKELIDKDEDQKNNSFEDFELKIKWKDFANDLSRQNKENLASILQINEPNLGNDFKITYDVPSNSSKNELREIKGDLLIYLKNIFKNDLIEIEFLVNKSNSKEYFSTPEERFKKLSDLNPNLIKLKKDLKLDL